MYDDPTVPFELPDFKHKYDVAIQYEDEYFTVSFAYRPLPGSGMAGILWHLNEKYPSILVTPCDDDGEFIRSFVLGKDENVDEQKKLDALEYSVSVPDNFDIKELVELVRNYYENTLHLSVRVRKLNEQSKSDEDGDDKELCLV